MTYQAASGAGAAQMKELVAQMAAIGNAYQSMPDDQHNDPLAISDTVQQVFDQPHFSKAALNRVPLAASAIPFIDTLTENGQSREEWKGQVEANKLLGREQSPIPIDGICVRIGTLRCHGQALTIMLDKAYDLDFIEDLLSAPDPYRTLVPNTATASQQQLTPAHVSGTLAIPVGRLRKSAISESAIHCYTVGDQLLWGAAEPLRCIVQRLSQGSWM